MIEAEHDPGSQAASAPSRHRPLIYGSVLALLALLGWGLMRAQSGPRSAGMAPGFTLETFDGGRVTLSELHRQDADLDSGGIFKIIEAQA